ncbi:zinc-binding dehydrogenase [Streptomyces tauricus]|uniref:zinc-binding dehydrogenase n=1 Tax=Streptomyces tauricus TaxID=68274 RepID=UPI0034217CC7
MIGGRPRICEGAVGHYAIELGRIAGARIVTTVSGPEKAALARAAGAGHVVNYRDADAAQQILDKAGPVDRIIEVSLDNLVLDLAVTGPGATIVTYAAQPEDPTLPVFRLMWSNLVLRFALFLTEPREALLRSAAEITAALREDALTPLPVHSFILDDVALAHEAVEDGLIGRAVVDLR